jgi:hypothetical protein
MHGAIFTDADPGDAHLATAVQGGVLLGGGVGLGFGQHHAIVRLQKRVFVELGGGGQRCRACFGRSGRTALDGSAPHADERVYFTPHHSEKSLSGGG